MILSKFIEHMKHKSVLLDLIETDYDVYGIEKHKTVYSGLVGSYLTSIHRKKYDSYEIIYVSPSMIEDKFTCYLYKRKEEKNV